MLNSFVILKSFDYSIVKFLLPVLRKYNDQDSLVRRVLFALYLLSYFKTGQPSIADIDFDAWSEEAQKRKKEVLRNIQR